LTYYANQVNISFSNKQEQIRWTNSGKQSSSILSIEPAQEVNC